MLAALQAPNPDTSALLPFAKFWYAEESSYAWAAGGATHLITQAEGGEQGAAYASALLPSVGSGAPILTRGAATRRGSLCVLGRYLHFAASPDRATYLCRRREHHLFSHARLQLNTAKTAFGNAAGIAPAGLAQHDCEGHGWVGDPALDPSERGLVVLGALLDQLPALEDAQVAWLLLSFCAAPRAQYALRTVPPPLIEEFAADHDRAMLSCLAASLSPGANCDSLRCGTVAWASALPSGTRRPQIGLLGPTASNSSRREPAFAEHLIASLAGRDSLPLALDSLRLAGHSLSAAGFDLPAWRDLSHMPSPPQQDDDPGIIDVTRGWQRCVPCP